jgi:hypothetical protein
MRKLDSLENGKIEKLTTSLRKLADVEQDSGLAKPIHLEAEHFYNNRDRMRYPEFQKQTLFVGSGVIEAGCKTAIGSRLKPACSGPCMAQTRSSHCAVVCSSENLQTIGPHVGTPELSLITSMSRTRRGSTEGP